jgi:CheY-like chemotaxis protein
MSAGGIWKGFRNDAGDEPSVRMFASEALQEFGYETMEASDATSGLNK